jgi:hypothetical protein
VTSPIDSLTPIWYKLVLNFCVYLLPIKSYSTFSICIKMPFEISWEGVRTRIVVSVLDSEPGEPGSNLGAGTADA